VTGCFNSVIPTSYGSYLESRSTNGHVKEDSSKDGQHAAGAFHEDVLPSYYTRQQDVA